jgi:hypothetical protein
VATFADSSASHPVVAFAARLSDALASIADVPVELMPTEEKAAALVSLTSTAGQLEALRLRLLAASDDVAADAGARDAGGWLAHETRADRGGQRRACLLGVALSERWHEVAAGLADGRVNPAQARVIAHALDELPDDVPGDVVSMAQTQLVEYAVAFGPRELRVLGRRILEVVAPEIGEEAEAKALEKEERRAGERVRLALAAYGDGTRRITGRIPDAVAQRLRTYLDAFTSPRQSQGADGAERIVPIERRRGEAFCALLEHLDPNALPAHGGDATTVVVTITLDQLRKELAAAELLGGSTASTSEKVSAGELRRLACNAGILPAVLGGASEVLDLGRTSRLFSRAQHKALRIRDRRCRARGCTIPATWCEAHHLEQWALGGSTDLDVGVLLCSFHHHRAHDSRYAVTRCPDGEVELRRRRVAA